MGDKVNGLDAGPMDCLAGDSGKTGINDLPTQGTICNGTVPEDWTERRGESLP